ncbi:hypothetical protein GQ600_3973 [Phytophthora cactorum]|nr:hypothetical protein GQ600_3973 [Phytophthora cactorum]
MFRYHSNIKSHAHLPVHNAHQFHDWEDKQLVRIALEFENEGIRVTWDYVARRMERSRRTPCELKVRLATLKRTYGKRVRDFPRCSFSSATQGRLLLSSGEASGTRGPPRAMTRRGTAPPRRTWRDR